MARHHYFSIIRFTVAIKSSRSLPANARIGNNYNSEPNGSDDLDLLVDEAKTMFSIGGYHENIVNLQGIGYEVDQINKCISTVRIKDRIIRDLRN